MTASACATLDPALDVDDPAPAGEPPKTVVVSPSLQGPAFPPTDLVPPSGHLGSAPVSYGKGPMWVSDLALPGTPLVLHIQQAVATARVTGLSGERAWFGVAGTEAPVRGGVGRTYQYFVASREEDADRTLDAHVVRLTLPVEHPRAHNLAIGELTAGAETERRAWRVIRPVERTAAFAIFELIGARDVQLRLTSAEPTAAPR